MTRLLALAALWSILLLAPAAVGAAEVPAQDDAPGDEIDTADDLPEGSRTIIGSPDPGPKPENPGDRGGWAQLMTLGVLVAGVGFIMWRVTRALRAAPAAVNPPGPRRSP
jgi:hypothetical protein